MPLGHGHIAKQTTSGELKVFHRRLYATRAPDLKTMHRVLSRGLKIAHIVERELPTRCRLLSLAQSHSALGPASKLGSQSALLTRQLVGHEGIAPLTYKRHIQHPGSIERTTQ